MSIRRIILFLLVSIAFLLATGTPTRLQENPGPDIIPGINVNMGSGIILPGGNPWHQQQNIPYFAISKLNSLLLLTSADNPPVGSLVNVDGFVQDPVTGVVEPAYAIQGIKRTHRMMSQVNLPVISSRQRTRTTITSVSPRAYSSTIIPTAITPLGGNPEKRDTGSRTF